MKRSISHSFLLIAGAALAVAPILRADVKTTDKTTMKMEGFLGRLMTRAAGGADGITSAEAVKGNRMIKMNDTTGEIIDLTEEKVYRIDVKKKEYKVLTFAEVRAEAEKLRADAEKQAKAMQEQEQPQQRQAPPTDPNAKQFEFEVNVKETGQRKTLIDQNVREVVLTITMHEKGKTLDQSGGMVMTNDLWIANKIAALDELIAFQMRYYQAIYGGMFAGADMAQMASLSAMMPGYGAMAEKMSTEGRKLQGTTIATITTIETVKSAEQMRGATDQSQQQQPQSGGGIGGMLGRRLGGSRAGGPPQQRATLMTTTHEFTTIATTVAASDVAIPMGFKEKK